MAIIIMIKQGLRLQHNKHVNNYYAYMHSALFCITNSHIIGSKYNNIFISCNNNTKRSSK